MPDYDHFLNPELLRITRQAGRANGLGGFPKAAFVPGGDPSGGGGGAPPGGDPSAGGGAPPPGGDPAAGGAPPGGDPGMAGGGAPPSDPRIDQLMQQMQQMQQQMQQGGGAGGAGGALKPKIDVNVEMMQIKNMLAKICDQLGVKIPAQDMVATPDKLMAMSQGQSTSTPGGDPGAGGAGGAAGGAGGGAIGGMPPMDPMQGASTPGGEKMGSYRANGHAFDGPGLAGMLTRVQAIRHVRPRAV